MFVAAGLDGWMLTVCVWLIWPECLHLLLVPLTLWLVVLGVCQGSTRHRRISTHSSVDDVWQGLFVVCVAVGKTHSQGFWSGAGQSQLQQPTFTRFKGPVVHQTTRQAARVVLLASGT